MTKKRHHNPRAAKAGELKFGWGREDRHDKLGAMVFWGDGVPRANANFLLMALCHDTFAYNGETRDSILKELEDRGFDLSTIKFSIQMKAESAVE